MLVILPPSETKRDGGADGSRLRLELLAHPELTERRRSLVAELQALAQDPAAAAAALRLGPRQGHEIRRNLVLEDSPVMPALDRYTGVLYDALGAGTLPEPAREFAARHVLVHSALFGLLAALDPIPGYRISHDSRLPGTSLKRHWADANRAVLDGKRGLVLDLRSEAYAALGPAPPGSHYLRVFEEGSDGRRKALNHFNKKGKGGFVRALLLAGQTHPDVESLLAWSAGAGVRLSLGRPGELDLVV